MFVAFISQWHLVPKTWLVMSNVTNRNEVQVVKTLVKNMIFVDFLSFLVCLYVNYPKLCQPSLFIHNSVSVLLLACDVAATIKAFVWHFEKGREAFHYLRGAGSDCLTVAVRPTPSVSLVETNTKSLQHKLWENCNLILHQSLLPCPLPRRASQPYQHHHIIQRPSQHC